jgi:hypothetical protein
MNGKNKRAKAHQQERYLRSLSVTTRVEKRRVPVLLWPFWAIWRLLTLILELTGRLVILVLGVVLLIVGVIVSLTVVGAVVGVPLALVGLMLISRGLF